MYNITNQKEILTFDVKKKTTKCITRRFKYYK